MVELNAMNHPYKWSTKDIREEFKYQDDSVEPNMSKVLQFQRHTDDLEECVEWAINSIYNDQEQRARRSQHGTGAC